MAFEALIQHVAAIGRLDRRFDSTGMFPARPLHNFAKCSQARPCIVLGRLETMRDFANSMRACQRLPQRLSSEELTQQVFAGDAELRKCYDCPLVH